MSPTALDVFALRENVIDDYRRFATSFTTIQAQDIKAKVKEIYASGRYWPEPLIQLNPRYSDGKDIQTLVSEGVLSAGCERIFRREGQPLKLYRHQTEAISIAASGESYVVTTGTGSGKSLCFFIPLVSHILAQKQHDPNPRTRAIIIYPMNALANSQLEEFGKFFDQLPAPRPVTFARYTGQESSEERRAIAETPPDILLTNFMMFELLMTRQDAVDRQVIQHCHGLEFLVLDELHTYRGRQGADVAMLVRRIREYLVSGTLQCIGTSATMASEGTSLDRNRLIAQVASKLFGSTIPETNIVVETLSRVTDPSATADGLNARLAGAIAQFENLDLSSGNPGLAPEIYSNRALQKNALAGWVETRLGIQFSEDEQKWVRAQPQTVSDAVATLAADSGCAKTRSEQALKNFLTVSSTPEDQRLNTAEASSKSLFAFKLHQFISGTGNAYVTLEPPGVRSITVEGQQFLPSAPDKRLYHTYFCRSCGHEYHAVKLCRDGTGRMLLPRDIDEAPPSGPPVNTEAAGSSRSGKRSSKEPKGPIEDQTIFGFLTLHAQDEDFTFSNDDEDYPETWLENDGPSQARLKSTHREHRLQQLFVTPDGRVGAGQRSWFIPGKFRFCVRCGHVESSSARDRTRLASLSAEGRSSATTVLVSSTLRWMHEHHFGRDRFTRKLLGFTDNRQDAALQAGHFNDFLFVSLVRSGFLGALTQAGEKGVRSENLGAEQQKALGLDPSNADVRAEWLLEPSLRGFNLTEAESTLRNVLSYRLWFDQRKGWRYTNPNLEQLGLVKIEYVGLEALCESIETAAQVHPALAAAPIQVRRKVFQTVLDFLRQGLAVHTWVLESRNLEQLLIRSHSRLRAPWGFNTDSKPQSARWMMITGPSRKQLSLQDETLLVRGGARSNLGRLLRSSELWQGNTTIRNLKLKDLDALIDKLLNAALQFGLVSFDPTPFGVNGWRLNGDCVVFKRGDQETSGGSRSNEFFRSLYTGLAATLSRSNHPFFSFEAREHTAQVESTIRGFREKRFRYGEKEQRELLDASQRLRELGENNRFLPVLFCSPTMELGVDISEMNVVHMRNVPPTPANYAQRSGRAGRSGQAALVLTYAAAQSPHDQYFFRKPKAMVHGQVKAPLLELANRDMIDSHLQAVWLSCVPEALSANVGDLLSLDAPERPIRPALKEIMLEPTVQVRAHKRMKGVLEQLSHHLSAETAPWYSNPSDYAQAIVSRAFERLEQALNRWRDLFVAAEHQRDSARHTMDSYASSPQDKRTAHSRHNQAMDQLNLLQKAESDSSDFYTYRYLATEGFLPGYNFPRLPLMAYIPSSNDGRSKQTYLQRPRFLALSEFGPRSLVYHEGRAHRVIRALLSLNRSSGNQPTHTLTTTTARLCSACGAGHFEDHSSVCHACGTSLSTAAVVNHIFRIENVATLPAERITANDEERQRQGFDLQTTFQWAIREHASDVRRCTLFDSEGDLLTLSYGAGATITRLNKGLRRRKDKTMLGFFIDPVSGHWAENDDEDEQPQPELVRPQLVVPSVRDHKNALLMTPIEPGLSPSSMATLQHALLRGIEGVFQLEEGEILAEPMPSGDNRRSFLFYEATEGGAGVLARLVAEPHAVAQVARRALDILHFKLATSLEQPADELGLQDEAGTTCVAACYRCVLSYYNQPDHELIDRRDKHARRLLLRFARAQLDVSPMPGAKHEPSSIRTVTETEPSKGSAATDEPSEASNARSRWEAAAAERRLPPPDVQPLPGLLAAEGTTGEPVGSPPPGVLVWRRFYLAVLMADAPPWVVERLEAQGFEVRSFTDESHWPAAFSRLEAELGRYS